VKKCAMVLGLAVVAALAAFTAAAHADGMTVTTFPVSFTLFDPCTDANVELSGTVLVVLDATPDDHGLVGHSVDVAIKGVGATTGTSYVEVATDKTSIEGTWTTADGGAYVETNEVHFRLIAPGPGNDFLYAISFHMTINANGELVVFDNRLTLGACA
jgi:hypothetical protein